MSKVDYLNYNLKYLDDSNINNLSLKNVKNVKINIPSEYVKNLENNVPYSISNIFSINKIKSNNDNDTDINKYSFDSNLNLLKKNYIEKYRSNNLLNYFNK
jgi:hypothetical protein